MKRGLYTLSLFLILSFIAQDIKAQYFKNQGYWKQNRFEFLGGIGASNFLGELGGRDQSGSNFIWDLETKLFKPAITGGFRYVTSRNTAVRAQLSYATLSGDDALTTEAFRSNRNIHFRSSLIEVGVLFEYTFYKVRAGHQYNLTGVKGTKPRAANFYGFLGVAGIRFNPKGLTEDGWHALQPLGTEGQNYGAAGGPYSLFSLAIPMGIGYKWQLANKNLMMGIEIGHRMTFTDYIDDVSTEYYNQAELGDQPGFSLAENNLAAFFADPSDGFYIDASGNEQTLNSTFEGAQRGDPTDNDAYLFVQATMSYKISKKPYSKKKFSSKKGKRVVF